jgi:c-di-GMP-binding flagellar brake protein YcgR
MPARIARTDVTCREEVMSSNTVRVERRGAQRFNFQLPVSIRPAQSDHEQPGLTQDLTAQGVFFYTDSALQPGTQVEIALVMPAEITLSENMQVRCSGKVVRVHKPDAGSKIGVAVQFDHYEYLQDSALSATPVDYRRVSTLHEHRDEVN